MTVKPKELDAVPVDILLQLETPQFETSADRIVQAVAVGPDMVRDEIAGFSRLRGRHLPFERKP
jgi:hypothetical protein